jgi:hypothetical protein
MQFSAIILIKGTHHAASHNVHVGNISYNKLIFLIYADFSHHLSLRGANGNQCNFFTIFQFS